MMKTATLLLWTFLFFTPANSQNKRSAGKKATGLNLAISADAKIPVGDFSSTHWGGIGLTAGPAMHTFRIDHNRTLGFVYEAGIAHYLGKKETVSGYPYKYPGYTFIHAYGGLSYYLPAYFEVRLCAGPAIGLYNGNSNFNLGASLTTNYHFGNRFSAGPSMTMMIDPGTNAIWAASLKATIYFVRIPSGNPKF